MGVRDLRQGRIVDGRRKSGDRVVRPVRLDQHAGLLAASILIVTRVRAVRSADFDQLAAGRLHDVGHAKRTADLDQLSARDDCLLARSQRFQRQQHRGRVVIDDGSGFRAGELAQQPFDNLIALATAAALEVVLQRGVAAHGVSDRVDRLVGQQRTAQIRMNHRAGQVEYRPHS